MNKDQTTLLITGGAGFIGANFIHYMLEQYPDYRLINVDKLTYAGSKTNLKTVLDHPKHTFIQADIADAKSIEKIFQDYPINGVIHFAAESHVDRSIQDSSDFVKTNVLGTLNLLQAAKEKWSGPSERQTNRFHYISTDEIYGALGDQGMFSEETPYDPRNPYSASKASANLMVKSFGHTYDMNVIISSCSNNYGPMQHEEKLMPTIIKNALQEKSIPIYGDGQNVRDWIHVTDHCRAVDIIFHHGKRMATYNVGGRTQEKNIDIAMHICKILDDLLPDFDFQTGISHFNGLIEFTEDRLGHDKRYAVDDSKLRNTLGWAPQITFESGLKQTVEWYVKIWTKQKT